MSKNVFDPLPTRSKQKLQVILYAVVGLALLSRALYVLGFYGQAGSMEARPIVFTDSDVAQGVTTKPRDNGKKEKACIVTFVQDSDLYSKLIDTIQDVEQRFNSRYHYDWVFLGTETFTTEFMEVTSSFISGNVKYGGIPEGQWYFPSWIDPDRASQGRRLMRESHVPDGDSVDAAFRYRFYSGFMLNNTLLDEYDYFMRIDAGSRVSCDINYDIFRFMRTNNKEIGFISAPRNMVIKSVKTLWNTTKDFLNEHPDSIHPDSMMHFISPDSGTNYNLCGFATTFEVGSLKMFRSEKFLKYFETLDRAGGFFYEKWTDEGIHAIAAGLFLPSSAIHYFGDIGFSNPDVQPDTAGTGFQVCPLEPEVRFNLRCTCEVRKSISWLGINCLHRYFLGNNFERPRDWEKARLRRKVYHP